MMRLTHTCFVILLIGGCAEVVDRNGDDGGVGGSAGFPCTEQGIRAAIAQGEGPHKFDCAAATTVTTEAEIVIDQDVILDGDDVLTVSGNDTHRVFKVDTDVTAELRNLVVTGGGAVPEGSGIYNLGTLTLTDSTVSANAALSRGGGVANHIAATLAVTNCDISGNSSGDSGGGIYNDRGAIATLEGTAVSSNDASYGGGIGNEGNLVVDRGVISGNDAKNQGGGIRNVGTGTSTLIDSVVSGNTAFFGGGGIHNDNGATLVLTTSRVSDNDSDANGGGILSEGILTVTGSTIAGNSSEAGNAGGLMNFGSAILTDSTISGNRALLLGGGITAFADGTVNITNCTISSNFAQDRGGGIFNSATSTLNLAHSTVSGNTAIVEASAVGNNATATAANTIVQGECSGARAIVSWGFNIESPGSTCGFTDVTDLPNTPAEDLLLGPLRDNGGPTKTHALLDDSDAINHVPKNQCNDVEGDPLSTDQRGEPRGLECDVGAFELQFEQ